MKLRLIAEKRDKQFFSYDTESKDMWAEKIKEAKDEFDVDFNTENDDSMDQQREIKIEQDHWDHMGPIRFACEMYSAGGDWEFPVRYFRCELKKGYAKGLSKYSNPHFVFVPNGKQGNGQLTKSDKGTWVCPDSDYDDEKEERDEKKCWDSLKEHLKGLVDDEVKEEVKESRQTLPESTHNRVSQDTSRRYRRSQGKQDILSQKLAQKLQRIV